jgi:hypothetical protein
MKGLPALLRQIARLRILVVGDVMLDHYIWGDATRISPEAPVPVWTSPATHGPPAAPPTSRSTSPPSAPAARSPASSATTRAAPAHARSCTARHRHGHTPAPARRSSRPACSCSTSNSAGSTARLAPGPLRHHRRQADDAARRPSGSATPSSSPTTPRASCPTSSSPASPSSPAPPANSSPSIPSRSAGSGFRDLDLITPNKRESLQLAGIEPPCRTPPSRPPRSAPGCTNSTARATSSSPWARTACCSAPTGGSSRPSPRPPARCSMSPAPATPRSPPSCSPSPPAPPGNRRPLLANAAAGVVVGKLGTATVTPAELTAYVRRQ